MTTGAPDFERVIRDLRASVADPRAGLFTPHSVFWNISREAIVALGGGRAVLLQLAHPMVAYGVDEHSAARTDPVGRFLRTFERVYDVIFGDLESAIAAGRRVHAVHGRVRGTIAEATGDFAKGAPYQAYDEGALFWVHATLIDSAVMIYERLVRPLSAQEQETYYEESKRFAQLFGVERASMPEDYAAFSRYCEAMWASERLTASRPAREMAAFLLKPPHPRIAPLWRWYVMITAGLLPPRIRAQYGLDLDAAQMRTFERSMRALRRMHAVTPPRLRYLPAYFTALRRVRGLEGPDWLDRYLRETLPGDARRK